MESKSRYNIRLSVACLVILLLTVATLACASAEPTATAVLPAQPAAPLPSQVAPTPTRTLPTATPLVTGKPIYGGTLRVIYPTLDVKTFDPHQSVQVGEVGPLFAMYNNLVGQQTDDSIAPELAQSWDISSDGKVVTFHLMKGIKFQDGSPFNAQAVKAHFDRIMDPNQISPRKGDLVPPFERAEVLDENTVAVRLTTSFRPLLATLSDKAGWIPSPAAIQKYGKDFGKNPVGTGPFVLKDWRPGGDVLLAKNDKYWDTGKPYLDTMAFPNVPDIAVSVAMLRTGEADVVTAIDPSLVPTISGNTNLNVVKVDTYYFRGFNINPQLQPFNNKLLRQAIAQGVDRDRVIKVVRSGSGRPAYTPISSAWANDSTVKPMPYDPQEAKRKLTQAGYPNGVTVPMACVATATELQACEAYQAMLKEVGINTDIKPMPSTDYYGPTGFIVKHGFGARGFSPRGDPHIVLALLFFSKGSMNGGLMVNPEADQIIAEAAATYDLVKARALYSKLSVLVADDAWWTFHYYNVEYIAMNKSVQNYPIYQTHFPRGRFSWFKN